MNACFEADEKTRNEVAECLYHALTYGWDIPPHICEHYGLREDYQLFHLIERMVPGVYRQRLQRGELPDIQEIDARLTNKVEAIFERLCPRPPQPYLERLNTELERLGGILTAPESIHDLTHIRPDFLVKYGINKNAPEKIRREQIQKAYDGLEIRMARLTGRTIAEKTRHPNIRPKGRRMGR